MSNLRERALAAYREAQHLEMIARERELTIRKVTAAKIAGRYLGIEVDPAEIDDDLTITQDGASVRLVRDDDDWVLRAVLTCCCGRLTTGRIIRSLADLGEVLASDEVPDGCPACDTGDW